VLGYADELTGAFAVAVPLLATAQTFGELTIWHPHVHALVPDGAFTRAGDFLPMPRELAVEPFLKIWEQKVFALLLERGRITPEVVASMRCWRHSGFSVDKSVFLPAGDLDGIERVIQAKVRCPFSLERILKLTPETIIASAAVNDGRP